MREAWRYDGFSQDVENRVIEAFGEFLTREDHKARMDRRLYEKDDTEAGVRAAARLGGNEPLIAKARISMLNKGSTKAALDAVPAAARNDIGYKFARIQMLRRADELGEAVALIKTIPKLDRSHDLDEWWIERRVLARKLLDADDAKDAYAVVRDATPPESATYRAEQQFMAGWIALRYLHDPQTAYAHFVKVAEDNGNPISLARGAYWSGRAAEAMHKDQEAQAALPGGGALSDRLLRPDRPRQGRASASLSCNPFPALSSADRSRAMSSDIVKAAELLYAVEARDLAWTMMADLGDKSTDVATLVRDVGADREIPRRPRHAADRQACAGARLRARPRRLPDARRAGLHRRSGRRSSPPSSIRSCGRKAGSIRRPSRAPTRSA